MGGRREQTITLADGRRLGFAEAGDTEGAPLLGFHGTPDSRLLFTAAGYDEALRDVGVRFVGVDRPGYGLSDPKPGRGHADWPADVTALADALGLDPTSARALQFRGQVRVYQGIWFLETEQDPAPAQASPGRVRGR